MTNYPFRKAAQTVMRYGMPIVDKMCRETEIVKGPGSSLAIGLYCTENGYRRPLIITDRQIVSLGLLNGILDSLQVQEITPYVFDQGCPDPTHKVILDACQSGRDFQADCIIAVGGGSVMDCAKVASIGIKHPNMPENVLTLMQLGGHPKALPLITIPTTAGTGAEITFAAVITDEKHKRKHFAAGPKTKARCCFLDAELTLNCPRELTAITAIDALSHALEGLMSPEHLSGELENALMEAVRKIFVNLPIALENPKDMRARQALCEAANTGGKAINHCSAGYAHSFAHVLGATYHIPHGAAIAMALPHIMEYNRHVSEKRMAKLSKYCGFAQHGASPKSAVEALNNAVIDLIRACEITDYSDRIRHQDYEQLVRNIFKDSLEMTPPKVMSRQDCADYLERIRTQRRGIFN